ncbi:MAG: MipA/OmpV family protein, partial [Burkholderiales bacterium]
AFALLCNTRFLGKLAMKKSQFGKYATSQAVIRVVDILHPAAFVLIIGVCAATLCALEVAVAQEPPQRMVRLGFVSVHEFEGSKDTVLRPFLVGRVDYGQYGSLRFTGGAAQYNLLGAKRPWSFGPLVSARPAHDWDVKDPVVRLMREVDAKVGAGLFAQYWFRDTLIQGDRLGVEVETIGSKDNQFTRTVYYQSLKTGAFQYGVTSTCEVKICIGFESMLTSTGPV